MYKSATHSDAGCRTQHGVGSSSAGNDNYAANYIDHPISLTAVGAPAEEEAFWPFGPTDEPVDTSGLFGSFGGVNEEQTDDMLFTVEEKSAVRLGLREYIVGSLSAMTRALVMVSILYSLLFLLSNSLYARMVKNTYGQPDVFGGITSTEDGLALMIGPIARPRTGCSNNSVNVLEDSGASGHYLNDAIIPGLRDRLEEYKLFGVPRKISTAGGGGVSMALRRECSGATLSTIKGVNSSARSSKTTALRRGCRPSTPAPTRRSKPACLNALEELLQLWCDICLPTPSCQI